MTRDEVVSLVAARLRKDSGGSAQQDADWFVNLAVLSISGDAGLPFNQIEDDFVLTVNQSRYQAGVDCFMTLTDVWGIQSIFITDAPGGEIKVRNKDAFDAYAKGNTITGKPEIATVHTRDVLIDVWPIPDRTYNCKATVYVAVAFDDIPPRYLNRVVTEALRYATANPAVLEQINREITTKMLVQQGTTWQGEYMAKPRHVAANTSPGGSGFDKFDTRGGS